jgi:hypothetical protein
MRKQFRPFLFASLVPALFIASGFAAVEAAQTNWSDPASWPNRKVPAAGDKVTGTQL